MRRVTVSVFSCVLLPLSLVTATETSARPRAPLLAPECNVSMSCEAPIVQAPAAPASVRKSWRKFREKAGRAPRMREALAYAPADVAVAPQLRTGRGLSMSGVVPPLAAKAAQISAACPGAHVISAVRHTRIRGTRRMSLHATGEAVDMRGNPSCIYAQLRNWPGGYSTDYGRAKHVHISLSSSGREMGLRFVHGGGRGKHHHRRMARR